MIDNVCGVGSIQVAMRAEMLYGKKRILGSYYHWPNAIIDVLIQFFNMKLSPQSHHMQTHTKVQRIWVIKIQKVGLLIFEKWDKFQEYTIHMKKTIIYLLFLLLQEFQTQECYLVTTNFKLGF